MASQGEATEADNKRGVGDMTEKELILRLQQELQQIDQLTFVDGGRNEAEDALGHINTRINAIQETLIAEWRKANGIAPWYGMKNEDSYVEWRL